MAQAAQRLRQLLQAKEILRTPCCHDALSARLIQRAGFQASFTSGFGVAATKALPDAGLVSFDESKQVVTSIIDAGTFFVHHSIAMNLPSLQSIEPKRVVLGKRECIFPHHRRRGHWIWQ